MWWAMNRMVRVFCVGLSLAIPLAGLVVWCIFGLGAFGHRAHVDWEGWLMRVSLAVVIVLNLVVLVMLALASRSDEAPPRKPSA